MGPVTSMMCQQPFCIGDTKLLQLLQVSHEGQCELRGTQGMAKFLFKPQSWLGVLDPSGWAPSLLSQFWALRLCGHHALTHSSVPLGEEQLAPECWWNRK